MSNFLEMRDAWRDALLKEYAEQDFEDDGTLLEVNVDTGDDDECCDMIKQKYADTLNYVYNREKVSHRTDMEDNYFDALEILNKNNILKGPVYETYHWWVKIMRIFFNIQSSNRGI